jgi:GNAT superfamily N-acetyltransferase
VITLTEEPYDGPVAQALVDALRTEINERYAHAIVDLTQEEIDEDDAAYLAEVTAEQVTSPNGTFVVAWIDREAVGCGALKRYQPYFADDDPLEQPERHGEIKRMYTAPSARRRGVSRVILTHLEKRAVELGLVHLCLETGLPQPEAIALYESAGWRRVEPYGHYRDSPESACFAKDLPER